MGIKGIITKNIVMRDALFSFIEIFAVVGLVILGIHPFFTDIATVSNTFDTSVLAARIVIDPADEQTLESADFNIQELVTPVAYSSAVEFTYREPAWMQWYGQYNNPYVVIGSGNMQSNGCVPTSAAMLLSAHGINVSPTDMGYYLYSTGNFNNWYGHGGTDLCWYDVAAYGGFSAEGMFDYDSFVSALQSGAIVACHIYYGGGTHAVLATGYDNGNTMVYDPIGGKYWRTASSLWNSQSYVWNDRLSGTSIIALW